MQINSCSHLDGSFQSDALIVGVLAGGNKEKTQLLKLDDRLTQAFDPSFVDALNEEIVNNSVRFSAQLGETLVLPTYQKKPFRYLVLTGLGSPDSLNAFHIRRASAAAIRVCQGLMVGHVASMLLGEETSTQSGVIADSISAAAVVEGVLLGNYKFTTRRTLVGQSGTTAKPAESSVRQLTLITRHSEQEKAIQSDLHWAQCVAVQTNLARNWVNDSANFITPRYLKEQAEQIPGLTCKIISFEEAEAMGMHSFTSVGKGSDEPSFLIHLTYSPELPSQKTVALVGKGVTFDSGGLSLKPPASMELMKIDMAGAATVLATMKAIAEHKNLPVTVHGIIPACENMVNGHSSKPGDVVTTLSGQTVEVNNTDAEGRLILCDALTYVQQAVKPDEIIDLATLTGACVVAFGRVCAAMMGTSDKMLQGLKQAGERAGEKFWELPLYDEYKEALKSDVADLKNAGAKGEAGSIVAGLFLKSFIQDGTDWVHLDIAGTAYINKEEPETPKGATGFAVRTLLYYLYQKA